MELNKRYLTYIGFGLLAAVVPILMLINSLDRKQYEFVEFEETGDRREDWSTCMNLNADKMHNTTWIKWPTIIVNCEKYITPYINLTAFQVGGSVMLFTYNITNHNFVPTILYLADGMREKDIWTMRKNVKWNNMTFIGTETVDVGNYTEVGRFFPERNETEDPLYPHDFPGSLKKSKRVVGRTEFVEFVTTYGRKFYDAIWLDWAAKDYQILPLTYRGDLLDELGITVCQFNVLIHYGTRVQEIHEFLSRTIREKRYAIIRPIPPGFYLNTERFPFAVPLTLYMLNIENKECVKRYTPDL